MAEGGQTGEELTCAICVESLREPVQLPCHHSFCRGCITMFSEKSKPKGSPESSTDPAEDDWLIACPMCRKLTKVWREGVASLSANNYSAEVGDVVGSEVKVGPEVKGEDCTTLCSLCEDDNIKEAIKFCSDCYAFYCEECLSLHPLRGKFKHHRLISVLEYNLQRHNDSPETEDEKVELCITHKQPLVLYCGACEQLCCLDCMGEHSEHPMSNKLSAYTKLKEPCVKITEDCKELKDKLTTIASETEKFLRDIKENEDGKKREIEKAYKKGLDVLNTWRKDALDLVEKQHSPLTRQTETAMVELPVKLAEIEKLIQEAENLPTSLTENFLQVQFALSRTIGSDDLGYMYSGQYFSRKAQAHWNYKLPVSDEESFKNFQICTGFGKHISANH